jgi:hypothetical protein
VQSSTAERTAQKLEWVRRAAGERFADLELEIGAYFTAVGDHAQAMATGMAGVFGLDMEAMQEHPHALFGTVESVCETLLQRRALYGISYVTVNDINMEEFAPVVAKLAGG